MIKITGLQKQQLLDSMARKATVAGSLGPREVIHQYTQVFSCKKAELMGDALVIKTNSEKNDAKILKKIAAIMDLDATVVLI